MYSFRCTLLNNSINSQYGLKVLRRLKSKKSKKDSEIIPCKKALNHFDDFYKSVFRNKWPSVRLALLSQQKNVAVINNFGEVEETEELLQQQGALELRSLFEVQKSNFKDKAKVTSVKEYNRQTPLDEVIEKQLREEEEKELNYIYPEGKDVQSKARFASEESEKKNANEESKEKEYVFDPDDTLSSLHSDLSAAEIDTNRLILPDSKLNETSLYEFVPATKLRGVSNYIPESQYFKYYQEKSEMLINIKEESNLDFPEQLKVYSFDRGDVSSFPEPTRCINNVYNFLEVDGADLLAVLALDVQPGDTVFDMCSTSPSKSYCIFQSLRTKILVCNSSKDVEETFSRFLFDYSPTWKDMLLITDHDFESEEDQNMFDKILVDVPCTDDKYSLFEAENNFFAPIRTKERLGLPEQQSHLLAKALKLVRPGGTVLYSTSTLSPVQNDGVVNEALKIVWQDTKMEFTVIDLAPALAPLSFFFNFGDYLRLKFGTLVVPFLPLNFGPKYFCKIVKNE